MNAPANGAATRQQTLDLARQKVRGMLSQSAAFRAMPTEQQREIARHTVEIANYLAMPEGIQGNKLATAPALMRPGVDPYAFAQDTRTSRRGGDDEGKFTAQAAREGAEVAGLLLQQVNFPQFVSGLIEGVFTSIVDSSIRQMEAYGQLVKSVAQTLNQFRDENVSANQGRDHLVEQYPDMFKIDIDTGEEGAQPRVRLRDGVDESAALQRVNSMPIEGGPLKSLDLEDEETEGKVVQAARTQLATSRQQLLATMVLMGINRIIVTEGKISAKVMYDFRARDNFRYQKSATKFDYDPTLKRRSSTGEYESDYQGGESEYSYEKDKGSSGSRREASHYAKGNYKYDEEPVMTLASASQATTDASLQTKATLAGSVEVNFKSETFPLEKMADSFQIGMIQNASAPRTGRAPAAGTAAPATEPATAAPTPAPAQPAPAPAT
jgi:hypothetical protein